MRLGNVILIALPAGYEADGRKCLFRSKCSIFSQRFEPW